MLPRHDRRTGTLVFAVDEQHRGGQNFEASQADCPSQTSRDTHVV